MDSTVPIHGVEKAHTPLQRVLLAANGAGPPYLEPGPWSIEEKPHHEGTAHPYLHQRKVPRPSMSWQTSILEAFEVFGPASLFILSFTEAILQPVPPDLLYIPMLVNAMGDTPMVVWLWLVVTVSSVLGSLVGYLIGQRWGTALMVRFGQEKHLEKLEQLTERYGSWGIFIAAFSPIPYKVLGWMAGMGEMDKKPFIIAGLIGRSLRFGLEAVLIGIYGTRALDALMWVLNNEVMLAIGIIASGAIGYLAWRWWVGLSSSPPEPSS